MSTSGNSQGSSLPSASTKPCFLTYNPETNDVFIWKSVLRLKVKGESAGSVRSILLLSKDDKTVVVSIM